MLSIPDDSSELTLFVAVIGFVAALLGALVGAVSNYITTSRQIRRQERDKRREVYQDVFKGISDFELTYHAVRTDWTKLNKLQDEADALNGYSPLTMWRLYRMRSEYYSTLSQINSNLDGMRARSERFFWSVRALSLFAPKVITVAASVVIDTLNDLATAVDEQDEEAFDALRVRLRDAGVNMIGLARADSAAPESPSLKEASDKFVDEAAPDIARTLGVNISALASSRREGANPHLRSTDRSGDQPETSRPGGHRRSEGS